MAALTVRDLGEDTIRGLRVRAAKQGLSMEAELRLLLAAYAEDRVEILSACPVSDEARREAEMDARIEKVQAKVRKMFGGKLPNGRVDAFLAERHAEAERGE